MRICSLSLSLSLSTKRVQLFSRKENLPGVILPEESDCNFALTLMKSQFARSSPANLEWEKGKIGRRVWRRAREMTKQAHEFPGKFKRDANCLLISQCRVFCCCFLTVVVVVVVVVVECNLSFTFLLFLFHLQKLIHSLVSLRCPGVHVHLWAGKRKREKLFFPSDECST